MRLDEIVGPSSSKEKSEELLRSKGMLKAVSSCLFCKSSSIGRVRRSSIKCYSCKKEWSIKKDSLLEDLRVPFSKFVLAIKLFVLEVSVHRAHKELGIAYNTAYKIYKKIRTAIYQFVKEDDMLSGEVKMDEGYFGGKRKGNIGKGDKDKIPAFGLLERGGKVKAKAVKDVSAENILKDTIKKVKREPHLHKRA